MDQFHNDWWSSSKNQFFLFQPVMFSKLSMWGPADSNAIGLISVGYDRSKSKRQIQIKI
jgi:hypothetical protein